MRKLSAVAILLAIVVSVTAYAGPFVRFENVGSAFAPTLDAGLDFSMALQSGPTIAGSTDWLFPNNDWTSSLSLAWAGVKVDGSTTLDFNHGLTDLSGWETSFKVTGQPLAGFTVWGGITVYFDPPGTWDLEPVFGLECHW